MGDRGAAPAHGVLALLAALALAQIAGPASAGDGDPSPDLSTRTASIRLVPPAREDMAKMRKLEAEQTRLAKQGDLFGLVTLGAPREDKALLCENMVTRDLSAAAQSAAHEKRTRRVVSSWQLQQRVAPLAEAARMALGDQEAKTRVGNFGLLLGALSGSVELAPASEDRDMPSYAFGAKFEQGCGQWLDEIGVPRVTSLPPDVAELGYAEYRVDAKAAAEVFGDPLAAEFARRACSPGGPERLPQLQADPVTLDTAGQEGITLLLWTMGCDSIDAMEALLKAGANPNQDIDKLGNAVMVAVQRLDPDALRLLLKYGGDANSSYDRNTALMAAFTTGRLTDNWRHWDLLVEAGADFSQKPMNNDIWDRMAGYNAWDWIERYFDRYDGDPVELGRAAEITDHPGIATDAREAARRVEKLLEARGVCFPVGATFKMEEDERGFLIQPDCRAD